VTGRPAPGAERPVRGRALVRETADPRNEEATMSKHLRRTLATVSVTGMLAFGGVACGDGDDLGDNIEDGADDLQDGAEDLGDDIQDGAEDLGDDD
jgi:hypothetical protein